MQSVIQEMTMKSQHQIGPGEIASMGCISRYVT